MSKAQTWNKYNEKSLYAVDYTDYLPECLDRKTISPLPPILPNFLPPPLPPSPDPWALLPAGATQGLNSSLPMSYHVLDTWGVARASSRIARGSFWSTAGGGLWYRQSWSTGGLEVQPQDVREYSQGMFWVHSRGTLLSTVSVSSLSTARERVVLEYCQGGRSQGVFLVYPLCSTAMDVFGVQPAGCRGWTRGPAGR
jgi:hypothetical protein